MSGSIKRPLFVIGKTKTPGGIKKRDLTKYWKENYESNTKAWMTGKLMFFYYLILLRHVVSSWLKTWDEELDKTGRNVLLYIDGCPGHKWDIQLKHIEVKFLPAGTTARSQVS